MNKIVVSLLMIIGLTANAQIKCEYEIEEKTDSTFLKKTTDYLIYEKDFVNTTEYLTFSLIDSDGVLYLQAQLLQKSNNFIPAKCLDTTSKIYLQLANGKIYTLINSEESCSQLVYNEKEKNSIRVLNGYFLFSKDNFEELKKSPISIVRIKYASETVDYVMKKELKSSNFPGTYLPENYFVNYLKCIQ
ncbi:hypothetical protein ABGT15_03245 [Flavobacterium enshiense]|uniref:hypothetical protein n=1 Tax=Flavobacterium enshiense TaxID=1341165 RepID=UPI00345CFAC7